MKRALVALLTLLIVCGAGCGLMRAVVPKVAEVVDLVHEFTVVLDLIEARIADHPEAAEVQKALGIARNALEGAKKATDGAEHLTAEEVDAAFDDFQDAYEALHQALDRAGLLESSGLLGGVGEPSPIPTPLELDERLEGLSRE